MYVELKTHIDQALSEFTSGEHYEQLLEAKEEYFSFTGQALEEDEDYEFRMNSFNDWYLFQFVSKGGKRPPIEIYLEDKDIEGDIKVALLGYNHSMFQYMGKSFRRHYILKDILHNKRITLANDHPEISLFKGDIFMGRSLRYKAKTYLTAGMAFLPKEISSILKKQARKVRKLRDPDEEINFLLFTESLKTKWQRYGHVELEKIFIYPELRKA